MLTRENLKLAVVAGASLTKAKGRLVAHNRNGKVLPGRFLPRIGGSHIERSAVTSSKLGAGAVGASKLAPIIWVREVSESTPPGFGRAVIARCPDGSRRLGGGFFAGEPWRVVTSSPTLEHAWIVEGFNQSSTDQTLIGWVSCLQ